MNDATTIVPIIADATLHALRISNGMGGTNNGNNGGNAMLDENSRPVMMGVSSVTATINGINYIEGETPVEIYGDPTNGSILVSS